MKDLITVDGSLGEGGGQVLRTSLALSLVTGRAFRIEKIRGNRKKGGLLRQHLTATKAAAEIGEASVEGGEMGSMDLVFRPRTIKSGDYQFSVGTAGSATLVLQTVLPALALADGTSTLVLEGGTHNPFAPPFDFLDKVFLPLLKRMGPVVECRLERHGFYPAGGGRISVTVKPVGKMCPLKITKRGKFLSGSGLAYLSELPESVGKRELKVVESSLGWTSELLTTRKLGSGSGPGNVLTLLAEFEGISEVVTGFGERGIAAEKVAKKAATEMRRYLDSGAPVGVHLADQLLVPMALAGEGSFRTVAPTEHTLTNIEVIKRFLDIEISCRSISSDITEITISRQEMRRKI